MLADDGERGQLAQAQKRSGERNQVRIQIANAETKGFAVGASTPTTTEGEGSGFAVFLSSGVLTASFITR